MKSLKTKVIMSAIVLVFALIATIGSTYAWFTVSTEVSVNGIALDVQSDESLLILIDNNYTGGDATTSNAANYSISISNAEILAAAKYSGMASWTIGSVTAAYGNDDGVDLTYLGLVNSGTTTLTTLDISGKTEGVATSNSATGDFVVIDFWLLSQSSTPEDVVLQDLTFTSGGGNSLGQDAIVNALRLMTHVASETDRIYSTDPDYDFTFNSGDPGFDDPSGLNSIAAGVRTTLIGEHSLFYDSVSGAAANISAVDLAGATVVATLASNTPTKVSVSIYIEGWDAEASTDILNAAFTVSFKFALQDVA